MEIGNGGWGNGGQWMCVLTFRIKLQDMDIAIGVRGDEVQLFSIREEVGGKDFDGMRRFAEES